MQRGDVFFVELPRPAGRPGHEQHGTRPAVVVQANCQGQSTVVIVPMTSNQSALRFESCFAISKSAKNGLTCDSVVLVPQVRAIDATRLRNKAGELSTEEMAELDNGLKNLLGITS